MEKQWFCICCYIGDLYLGGRAVVGKNLGGWIERWWDKCLKKTNDEFERIWDEYLKLTLKDEIIGQRYLRDIRVRMKFELSMVPALLLFSGGLAWFQCLSGHWNAGRLILPSAIGLLIAAYLLWESFSSAKILADVRALLVSTGGV